MSPSRSVGPLRQVVFKHRGQRKISGPRRLKKLAEERPKAVFAQIKYVLEYICSEGYIFLMQWTVLLHTAFESEFAGLPEIVQDELLAHAKLLERFGPQLGRPRVDTRNGSKHANMKELRFDATVFGGWLSPLIRSAVPFC